ncbi:MAG: hypothetical protein ACK5PQ_03670 [Alphaproteobacteria bacterium]
MIFFYFVFLFFISKSFTASYVPGTEDVPLMNGMQPSTDSPTAFDSVQGRIVSAKTFVSEPREIIENFYDQTLQNLGWAIKISGKEYIRDKQILKIQINKKSNKNLEVSFELTESK